MITHVNDRLDVLEIEHDLHVDQGLPKLTVNGTKEVEREGELENELVDKNEIADSHSSLGELY